MSGADKGGENRFIFFSGVVTRTTPFFCAWVKGLLQVVIASVGGIL